MDEEPVTRIVVRVFVGDPGQWLVVDLAQAPHEVRSHRLMAKRHARPDDWAGQEQQGADAESMTILSDCGRANVTWFCVTKSASRLGKRWFFASNVCNKTRPREHEPL